MNPTDLPALQEALTECYSLFGKNFVPGTTNWWAKALKNYSLVDVRTALMTYSKSADYAPKPKSILELLATSVSVSSAKIRCCFEADHERCPLVGHYDLHEGSFNGQRFCSDHHNLRADFKGGIAYMHMAIEGRLPKFEHANDRVMRELTEGKQSHAMHEPGID